MAGTIFRSPRRSASPLLRDGAVYVLYATTGIEPSESYHQLGTPSSAGLIGSSVAGELFGYALAAGNYAGSVEKDLAVVSPSKPVFDVAAAGQLFVIHGAESALTFEDAGTDTLHLHGLVEVDESFDVSRGDSSSTMVLSTGEFTATAASFELAALQGNEENKDTVVIRGTPSRDVFLVNLIAIGTADDPLVQAFVAGETPWLTTSCRPR